MRRHTVYVAMTFEVDDDALAPGGPGGVPDVELVQRLVDAVAVERLASAGVRLVSPTRSREPGAPMAPADPECGRPTVASPDARMGA